MRLFIAIKIPDTVKTSLARFISQAHKLPEAPQGVKWVRPENFHLTLKFMGEVGEDQVESLEKALGSCVAGGSFPVNVQGIGAFPSWKRARVLWAGTTDEGHHLKSLADLVEQATVQAGFSPADHPFSAHLTLARFQVPPLPHFETSMQKYSAISFGAIQADRMFLIRSRLESGGSVYTDLREFPFHEAH